MVPATRRRAGANMARRKRRGNTIVLRGTPPAASAAPPAAEFNLPQSRSNDFTPKAERVAGAVANPSRHSSEAIPTSPLAGPSKEQHFFWNNTVEGRLAPARPAA